LKISNVLVGVVFGVILTGVVGWRAGPGLMLKEYQSPFGVDETVEKIKANAIAEGWVVSGVTPLNDSVKKHGGGELPPIRLVNLCQANHAFNILQDDANKIISVMMPCTISVYQKSDGKTYIGTMNAGVMGKVFGGTVAEVMGGQVAEQQQKFIAFAKQ
jgi:uncharacterized protein (DUF302 family)